MFQFTCDEFLAQIKQITGQPYKMAVDCTASISNIFKEAGVRDFKEFPEHTFLGIPELQIYFTKNTGRSFDDSYVNVDLTFSAPRGLVGATYDKEKSSFERECDMTRYFDNHGSTYYNYHSGVSSREPAPFPSRYNSGSIKVRMDTMPTFHLKAKFPLTYALKNGSKLFEHSDLKWQWWRLPSHDESRWNVACLDKHSWLSVDPTEPNSRAALKVDETALQELPFTSQDASAEKGSLEACPKEIVSMSLFLKDEGGHYSNIDIVSVDGKSNYKVFKAQDTLKEALGNIEKSR